MKDYLQHQINTGHEAQVTSPEALFVGMDIAVCTYDPPTPLGDRLSRAFFGALLPDDQPDVPAWQRAKEAWKYNDEHGVRVLHTGTVDGIDTDEHSVQVVVSSRGSGLMEHLPSEKPVYSDIAAGRLATQELRPIPDKDCVYFGYTATMSSLGLEPRQELALKGTANYEGIGAWESRLTFDLSKIS